MGPGDPKRLGLLANLNLQMTYKNLSTVTAALNDMYRQSRQTTFPMLGKGLTLMSDLSPCAVLVHDAANPFPALVLG